MLSGYDTTWACGITIVSKSAGAESTLNLNRRRVGWKNCYTDFNGEGVIKAWKYLVMVDRKMLCRSSLSTSSVMEHSLHILEHRRCSTLFYSVSFINHYSLYITHGPWIIPRGSCVCWLFCVFLRVFVVWYYLCVLSVYYLSVCVRPTAWVYVWINGYSSYYLWPTYWGSTTHYRGLYLISDTTSGALSRIHLEWTNSRTCGIVEETFNDFNFYTSSVEVLLTAGVWFN